MTSIEIGGDAIFAKQAELVRSAKDEVLIQTFSWDPNSPGAKMILDSLAALADAQSDGANKLKVRLMVNEGTGWARKFMMMTSTGKGKPLGARWPSPPESLTGNYRKSPDHKYAKITEKLDFQVRVHQHKSSNSLHSKSLVVDGKVAAVTGANVQSRNHGETPAYDFGVSMSGPVASGLRDDFVNHWNDAANPDQKTRGMSLKPTPDEQASGGVTMALLTRKANWNVFHNGISSPQDRGFVAAMRNARNSIKIMTPNLNAPTVRDELVRAANRGVTVQLLISKGFNDERAKGIIAGGTNDDSIQDMARRVRYPSRLQISYFQNPANSKHDPIPNGNVVGNGSSHAKFMAVDGEVAIVGSSNMDKASWHFSAETNAAILDAGATQAITDAIFTPAWIKSPRLVEQVEEPDRQ